jgi:hydrogenase maturation factor
MTERLVAHGCITCGDEAIPMRVLEVDSSRGLALCGAPGGVRSSVEIALVEPVSRGEVLLVHAGTALGRAAGEQVAPTFRRRRVEGAGMRSVDEFRDVEREARA